MLKKCFKAAVAVSLCMALLSGCGQTKVETTNETSAEGIEPESAEADALSENEQKTDESATKDGQGSFDTGEQDDAVIRVGSLKGPTTIGIVNLMKDFEDGTSDGNYEFEMSAMPDEIAAKLVSGDIDIALIPANLASVLYNKTEGKISLVDINTLGVLYCVSGDESIDGMKDLAGKEVLMTGQGTIPEYAFKYLCKKYEVSDAVPVFKSEATEIAATLKEDPSKVAILPQPFATVAAVQNENLHINFSLTGEWDKTTDESKFLTGVTVVRNDFLNEHPDAVRLFLDEHEKSATFAQTKYEETAELIVNYGIIENKEVAQLALPGCNIVCISGEEAKTYMEGFLQVLYDQDQKSVGGKLPGDDFYDNFSK
ncbi:MAG: ABC transporter substrate-binding protein [Butyrivibrio sp.]|nr:ABC transporter substrate-binding protein [Butyrivibrio sp.]